MAGFVSLILMNLYNFNSALVVLVAPVSFFNYRSAIMKDKKNCNHFGRSKTIRYWEHRLTL